MFGDHGHDPFKGNNPWNYQVLLSSAMNPKMILPDHRTLGQPGQSFTALSNAASLGKICEN